MKLGRGPLAVARRSYTYGAVMRVSAELRSRRSELSADKVTEVSRNRKEGSKGVRGAMHATWLAFQGERPEAIRTAFAAPYG